MYLFITIIILIVAIAMVLIVLVQNSKGGGLASGFSSSNQIMGVRKTTDFLEKATWTLAGLLVGLSLLAAAFIPRGEVAQQSEIVIEQAMPMAPAMEAPVVEEIPVPAE